MGTPRSVFLVICVPAYLTVYDVFIYNTNLDRKNTIRYVGVWIYKYSFILFIFYFSLFRIL